MRSETCLASLRPPLNDIDPNDIDATAETARSSVMCHTLTAFYILRPQIRATLVIAARRKGLATKECFAGPGAAKRLATLPPDWQVRAGHTAICEQTSGLGKTVF
jgi:hypothetical protein